MFEKASASNLFSAPMAKDQQAFVIAPGPMYICDCGHGCLNFYFQTSSLNYLSNFDGSLPSRKHCLEKRKCCLSQFKDNAFRLVSAILSLVPKLCIDT